MLKIKITNIKTTTQQNVEINPAQMIEPGFIVGRSQECNHMLNSPEISRRHGKFIYNPQNQQYQYSDLGSTDGSYFNKQKLPPNFLQNINAGDSIGIGSFVLLIESIALPSSEDLTKVGGRDGDKTILVPEAQKLEPKDYIPVGVMDPREIKRWIKGDILVKCSRIVQETSDVRTFCFTCDPPVLFTYKPGQFVTLNLEINGEEVLRSYSISSTPSRPHTLEITVKRVPAPDNESVPPGLVSNWLHDNIRVGDEIKLSGPMGKFSFLINPSQKLLFISAGSGITPMMSMSRWIYDTGSDCDITFIHSAKTPEDIIYRQELEWLAARQLNFNLAITVTRLEPGQSWSGYRGRLSDQILRAIAPDFKERTVYVCGPDSFMKGTKELLDKMGFPMSNYYEESFGSPKKSKKPSSPSATQGVSPPPVVNQTPVVKPAFGIGAFLGNLVSSNSPTPTTNTPVANPTPTTKIESTPTPSGSGISVVFSKTNKEVSGDESQSILEIAESEGVKIRSSCRSGTCGTCKKRKIEGSVKMSDYDPEALEPSEVESGYILTCISYPEGRVVIEA